MNLLTVTAFVVRHYGPARGWSGRVVLPWLRWFADDQRAVSVIDSRGRMVAFGCARCLTHIADAKQRYAHVEGGPIVFVDLAVARTKGALRALWAALRARFGVRARVAWQRFRHEDAFLTFNFSRTERLVYGK